MLAYGLLCMAICGMIMSSKLWVKILCTLYLAFYVVVIIVDIINNKLTSFALVAPAVFILLGMYVYDVHHMFDPKDKS